MRDCEFKVGCSRAEQIQEHLLACDKDFPVPLSSRVSLAEYSQKLHDRAIRFEAWCGQQLVALVGAYDARARRENELFVSNVSVLPEFRGRGLAKLLLRQCIAYAVAHEFSRIRLEVDAANAAALALYKRLGFIDEPATAPVRELRLTISSGAENVNQS